MDVYRVLGEKGRLYLPKAQREAAGIYPGSIVRIHVEKGVLQLSPVSLIEVGDHSPEAVESYLRAASRKLENNACRGVIAAGGNREGGVGLQEILLENGFVYYYANRIGYRKGDVVYVDPVFHTRHLKQRLKEDYGLYTKEQEGLYKRLLACMVYKEDGKAHVQFCRIWQWREEVPAEKKFLTYQAYTRLFGTVDINDYQVVYDGYSETDVLEAIFQKFHTNIPEGFPGHAIRMSDMIELYGEDGTHTFYYVDEFGFVEIEGRELDETVERTPADCRLGQSGVGENNDSDEACHAVSEREETDCAGV